MRLTTVSVPKINYFTGDSETVIQKSNQNRESLSVIILERMVIRGKANQEGGAHRGSRGGVLQLKLPSGGKGANRSWRIANRGFMSH